MNRLRIEIPDGQYLGQTEADVMLEYLNDLPNQGRLLEIGTGMGHSTKFFSIAKPNWTIYTIDGFGLCGGEKKVGGIFNGERADEAILKTADYLHDCNNVIQIIGDSSSFRSWELSLNAMFIDGTHTYESVNYDFQNFSSYIENDGVVFFHDYHREDYGVRLFVDNLVNNSHWQLVHGHKIAVIKRKW